MGLRKLLIVGSMIMITISSRAQDPLFTQFYHSPVYLNPAFTGCGKNDFRACFTGRMQWLNLPDPLQYYTASVDKYFADPKASLGFVANHFNEGYIKTTQLYLIAAKNFGDDGDNCDRRWFVNFAFQGGLGWRNADRSKLLFPDQLDPNGLNGQASQFELFQYAKRAYLDLSAGMVFTYGNVMFGAAAYHMNNPVNGLFGTNPDDKLTRRYTFHLSFINDNYPNVDKEILLKPTIIFNTQGVSKSLVVGSFLDFPYGPLEAGIWYRNNFGLVENHTIGITVTFKLGKDKNYYNGDASGRFNTGVSYEGEITRPGVRYTKGSSELGMLFEKNLESDGTCPKPYGCATRFPWVFF